MQPTSSSLEFMSEKYQNKYRIPSARLQNWDYGSNGAYFITICTANRTGYFCEIIKTQLIASELGKLAQQYWMEIPNHFPFVELGNFVVMPNHVHGIIIIDKMNYGCGSGCGSGSVETLHCNVSTAPTAIKNEQMAKISPKSGTISTIIRSYKSVVSKNARIIHADFAWQSRFHDHIIRNAESFERIQNYISNNPQNWCADKFNSING